MESGENPVGGRLYEYVDPREFLDRHSHMYDALIKSFGGYEDDARERGDDGEVDGNDDVSAFWG